VSQCLEKLSRRGPFAALFPPGWKPRLYGRPEARRYGFTRRSSTPRENCSLCVRLTRKLAGTGPVHAGQPRGIDTGPLFCQPI